MSRTLVASVASLLAGFTLGAGLLATPALAQRAEAWDALDLFAEVMAQIRSGYVEEVSDDALVYAAVRGMFEELDPHSRFMDPDEYRSMRDSMSGQYVGIGIEVGNDDTGVVVRTVLAGDRFVSIDGEDATGFSVDDIVGRLRGPRGESVAVELLRPSTGETLAFTLVRDTVRLQAVTSSLVVPGIGLVGISSFQENVGNELRAAIDRLQSDNGGPLDGLVLDLRGNPGGLLNEAIDVSDVFLSDGVIVSTAGRGGANAQSWSASRSGTRFDGPLVVLVDANTASASEIVAGALQDHGRAAIVGLPTYGKGSVQSTIDLPGGAGMKLTISLYYTPAGRSIQSFGISPDLEIQPGTVDIAEGTTRGREAALGGTLANPGQTSRTLVDEAGITDAQLRAALQQLHVLRAVGRHDD